MKQIQWSGALIDKPCVVKGVPIDEYHSQNLLPGPSVSSSNLRRVLEVNGGSPAHFFSEWSGNPRRVEPSAKTHLTFGRAVHLLMLGEGQFSESFAVRPTQWDSWRTQAAKDWREATMATGRSVLTDGDLDAIREMAEALGRDPLVRQGLLGGQIERSFFWQDRETGLWCKARPDAVPTDSGDFADYKSTTSVQYDDLAKAVRSYAYHQQAALIIEGAKLVAGIDATSFTFCFQEKTPPYCVRCLQLKPEAIALGHRQNRVARHLIAGCLNSGYWPGPGEGNIVSVDLGTYYHERADRDLEELDRIIVEANKPRAA